MDESLRHGRQRILHATVNASKNRFGTSSGLFASSLTPTYPDDAAYALTGVFGQWNVDLTDCLSGLGGVRYTHAYASGTPTALVDDDNNPITPPVPTPIRISPSYSNWSASGGLNLELGGGWHLTGSVAQGFRAPNLDDLTATNDNVQQSSADTPSIGLRPETSTSYDVGLKTESCGLRGQLYYFWMDIDDMILRTPAGMIAGQTLFSRSNRDSHINGLEMAGSLPLHEDWELYGNISYYLGEDLVLGEPLSRIPPTQGVLGLRWRDARTRAYVDVFAWLVARQDRLNFQDLSDSRIPNTGTPGFAVFNIRTGCRLTPHQRVSLNVENILDQAYRVHGSGVDGPGASAIVTYELNW